MGRDQKSERGVDPAMVAFFVLLVFFGGVLVYLMRTGHL
jgi:hypothetical protein